jgi:hypothetical protein
LRQIDWLFAAAKGFDAVVIAGDHIDAFSALPGSVQIAALSATYTALAQKSRLLVCSGNHDLNAWNGKGEKRADWLDPVRSSDLAVDGDTVDIGDTLFTVCPWWDGPHTRVDVERMLELASQRRSGRWVWVYHAPPEGVLSWTGKRHYGDAHCLSSSRYCPPPYYADTSTRPLQDRRLLIDRIGDLVSTPATRSATPARIEIISGSRRRAGSRSPASRNGRFNSPARRRAPSRV